MATWDATFDDAPSTDPISSGDDAIRDTREETRLRLQKEMGFGSGYGGTNVTSDSGYMREGSARAFYNGTEPTAIYGPAGTLLTTLAATDGAGRLWVDSDGPRLPIYAYSGTAFTRTNSFQGAMVRLTAGEPITNDAAFTTYTVVAWDDASTGGSYETISTIWDGATPTRLTVPTGVTRVRLSANIAWTSNANGSRAVRILKSTGGGAAAKFQGMAWDQFVPFSGTVSVLQNIVTAVVTVVATDYFVLEAIQNSGAGLNILSDEATWFAMEIIE